MQIDTYIRICKDPSTGSWDVENAETYTWTEILQEAIDIDYIDEDEAKETNQELLIEVFERNDELLVPSYVELDI